MEVLFHHRYYSGVLLLKRTILTDLFPTLWETTLGGATYGAIGAEEMPKA